VTPVGTETVSGRAYRIYPAPFASNAAKGNVNPMASNTGDSGSIQVCADYNYSGTNYKHVTTSASTPYTVTNFNAPTTIPVIDVTSALAGPCP
jgi:hypothetical protein